MSPQATTYITAHGSLEMALCQAQVDADNTRDWNAPIHGIKRELQAEYFRRAKAEASLNTIGKAA
jgi:hypothetical protein